MFAFLNAANKFISCRDLFEAASPAGKITQHELPVVKCLKNSLGNAVIKKRDDKIHKLYINFCHV